MSRRGMSEQVMSLREAIVRIERNGAPRAAFGVGDTPPKAALGGRLDRVLRGGLARGTIGEVVAGRPGDAGAAAGFALAMAARFAAQSTEGGGVVWILEDGAWAESGAPYAPGLAAHGLDPARLVVVRARTGADGLWAAEEALRCRSVAAVVLDLWRTKAYDLVASRRLVLAAAASGTPGLVVMAGAPGTAAALSSAAQVRFEVAAARAPPLRTAAPRQPLPGLAAFAVRLARIRAGPAGASFGHDWEKVWPLVWNHQEARFCDALPVPPSAVSRDRPHPAAPADVVRLPARAVARRGARRQRGGPEGERTAAG